MKAPRKAVEREAPARSPAIEEIIGAELARRRKGMGLSRNDFAALVGVTQQKMRQVESGAQRLDPATFLRAARVLGIRPSDIFRDVASVFSADLAALQHASPVSTRADHAVLRCQLERIMDKCDDIIRIIDFIDADDAR